MNDVTVVIPSIPPRGILLGRAVSSASTQTLPAKAISVAVDVDRQGAGPTRTRALNAATTEWVAFLDDDDEMYPFHLATLMETALEHEADVVWSWYDVIAGIDPLRSHEGRQWNPKEPHLFPITTLVRTALAQEAGFAPPIHPSGEISGEDYPFWLQLNDLGAKFIHVCKRTWAWHHDSKNTSGMPNKW